MRVLKFIIEATKPYRLALLGMILAMTFVVVDATVKPYIISTIIDKVATQDYTNIWHMVCAYIAMQIGIVLAWAFFEWSFSKLAPLAGHITQLLLNRLNLYPYRFFQEHLSGSISSKISDVATFVPQIITHAIDDFFQIALLVIVSVFMLWQVHYGFGLAILVWILVFVFVCSIKMKKAASLSNIEAEADAQIWGNVVDYITNMFSIKIFSSYSHERTRLKRRLADYATKSRTKVLYFRDYSALQGSLFSIYIIACLIGMVYLNKQNLITPGDFALVFTLNSVIIDRLFQATVTIKNVVTNIGTVSQALVILEDAPDILDKPEATELELKKGEIVFDSVKFHYKGTEPLFQNKSVTIAGGQKVGLVGYSGGGKSTFVNLILRLYDVADGRILIDGQDISNVTQKSLHDNIAMIPQDPMLFHRTVMENIRYGNPEAEDKDVIRAAKKAHAHEFISNMNKGYDSLVGDRGIKLSGGQRQRISIARAILRDAPILILDEATSQLDSVTEDYIQESLSELMQNKTTIIIAHRLSTLLCMDRILVFDKGKIVEDGTHKELLKKKGLYKTLWDAQVGGFLPDNKDGEEAV